MSTDNSLPDAASSDLPESPEITSAATTPPDAPKRPAATRASGKSKAESDRAKIQKLLSDSGDFDFGTLISGVSTMNQPGIVESRSGTSRLPTPMPIVETNVVNVPNDSVCKPAPFNGIATYSGKLSLAAPDEDEIVVGAGPLESHQAHVEHLTSKPEHGYAYVTQSVGRPRRRLRMRGGLLAALAVIIVGAITGSIWLYLFNPDVFESFQAGLPIRVGAAASRSWLKQGLPDPRLTPGVRSPSGARPQPISRDTKALALQSYGLDPSDKQFRVARLIPAGIGGTNDPQNLFPLTPYYFALKAKIDKAISEQVRLGNLTAGQAELALKRNWIDCIHSPILLKYGFDDAYAARKSKELLKW